VFGPATDVVPRLVSATIEPEVPPKVLFSVAALIITPQLLAICVGALAIVVVVVQLALLVQLAPVPGATVLTRLPEALAVVETSTLAVPPLAARPVGIVQVSVWPETGLQVAPVGVTVTLPMPLDGRVSVSVIGAAEAPVPELVAVSVQLIVSPMKPVVLLTPAVTVTFGTSTAATVVVVVQVALDAQLAPLPGATVLTRLPTAVAVVPMVIVAVPLVAARPGGIVHVSVLPEIGLQLAPVGVTVTLPMPLAGSVSVSVMAEVDGPPVLVAVIVQLTEPPVLTAA